MMTLEEAARYLGVSKTSLRRWTNSGELKCHRIGPRAERRFDRNMLDEFLLRRSTGPALPNSNNSLTDAVANAAHHGRHKHVCLYYRNHDAQWNSFRGYFLDHYQAGQPTTYLYSSSSRQTMCERITAEGIDPDDAIRSGLLSLIPAEDAYLRQGAFSANFMVAFMKLILFRRQSEGFNQHLITGEMDWFFSDIPGVHEIHTYEQRLNCLMNQFPEVTIVCQYDVTRFDGEHVLAACQSHPIVQFDDQLRQGFYDPLPEPVS